MDEIIIKNFIETLLKLQRDTIIVETQIKFDFGDDIISYNQAKKCWLLNDVDWNPTISEIIEYLNKYQEFEILIFLQNYEDYIKVLFESINSIKLLPKFYQILTDIVNFTNKIESTSVKLPHMEFGENILLKYDRNRKEFFELNSNKEMSYKTVEELVEKFKTFSLLYALNSLNNTWKMLN